MGEPRKPHSHSNYLFFSRKFRQLNYLLSYVSEMVGEEEKVMLETRTLKSSGKKATIIKSDINILNKSSL